MTIRTIGVVIAAVITLAACSHAAATHKAPNHHVAFCRALHGGAPGDQCVFNAGGEAWNNPTDAANMNPNSSTKIWVTLPASCTLGDPQPANAAYWPCVMDESVMASGGNLNGRLSEGDTVYISRSM